MCWFNKKQPRASREAIEALHAVHDDLQSARQTRMQVHEVQKAASVTLAQNHFGASITAAMGGPIYRER